MLTPNAKLRGSGPDGNHEELRLFRRRTSNLILGWLFPLDIKFAMRRSAISEIKIDEALIWNADFFRDRFEIVNRLLIKANGDLPFELSSIWIFFGF